MNTFDPHDLIIRAGRLFCQKTGHDGPGAVAIRGGRIVAVGKTIEGTATQSFDFPNAILLPGLIDLHAHPACGGSVFGVEPDENILARGTTTVLSQGDAGADNIESYVRETIEKSQIRVRLAINLSRVGESTPEGCLADLENADVATCVAAIEKYRDHIWGVAVNVSHHACEQTDPHEVLRRGLAAAEATGLPILYGMRRPEDWPLGEQLELLREGDVVTYCFRRSPHCIIDELPESPQVIGGRINPAIRAARERGVLFDIGHGTASFDLQVARCALAEGFAPDTISTDLQRAHLQQSPSHDLPRVMSLLRRAGMREAEIFAAVTDTPARVLGLDQQIGVLAENFSADLTVLVWHEDMSHIMETGKGEPAAGHWETVLTVREGNVVEKDCL